MLCLVLSLRLLCTYTQSTYRGRVDIGGVYLPFQLERIHHNFVPVRDFRYSERGHSHPHQAKLDFSIMMECTPESGHCESSVYNAPTRDDLLVPCRVLCDFLSVYTNSARNFVSKTPKVYFRNFKDEIRYVGIKWEHALLVFLTQVV